MITYKQLKFSEKIFDRMSKVHAYSACYGSNKMSSKTTYEAASRLSKNPKVIARLNELRAEKEAEERVLRLSYGDLVINELKKLALNAKSDRARVKALELLGKTVGMFITK